MKQFAAGGRVRIDIPDEHDPDYTAYHGENGTVVNVPPDEVDAVTGGERDAFIYRVDLASGEQVDFRWRDLRLLMTDRSILRAFGLTDGLWLPLAIENSDAFYHVSLYGQRTLHYIWRS